MKNEYDDCIKVAEAEAKRFLDRVKAWKKRASEDHYSRFGCKESGAVTRASLDLTRALADLRRPIKY